MHLTKNLIIGEYPEEVERIEHYFGSIDVFSLSASGVVVFTIHQVLPNMYMSKEDNCENLPLFILVPNVAVSIWPHDIKQYDRVRCAVTLQAGDSNPIHALAIFKDNIGVYICLSPINRSAMFEVGNLGI